MSSSGEYRIPSRSSEVESRVKGSRFIAICRPATDSREASAVRDVERRRFHDATHHVYASRLRSGEERFDDDGEPSGTAGRPVLASIHRAGLVDVVVVVTRYYGGTKLGTGGLGRAYAAAAKCALGAAGSRSVATARKVIVSFEYADTGIVTRCAEAAGAVRLADQYGERAGLELAIRADQVDRLREEVTELTGGRGHVRELDGEMWLPLDT
ncbi:MAG: YigZ family protein [marine benthic group bacterium]|nr:YigZ family protein [Candidatus Benthicola marisminoris]